ncbi:MAG: transglycosylase domain-containing protein [Parvularculaceae bacterium]
MTLQRAFGVSTLAAVAALALLAALDIAFPPPLERAADRSVIVLDRDGAWLYAFANRAGRWRFAADLDAVDPTFLERVVAVEDKRFFAHAGVDPLAIARAVGASLRAGRIVSGASTITMQTARLLEPRPRTLGAKAIEAFRALQIERRLTKNEILALYLTLAPYGGNIEGVRAASLIYFGKEPTRLSDAEQALLIALPQAPEARRPDRRPAAARAARDATIDRLASMDLLAASAANALEPPARRGVYPRAAYHAASAAAAEARVAPPADDTVRLSLDRRLQTDAAAGLRRWVADRWRVRGEDGATAAAVIVRVETGEVLASVGSSGVDAPGGWIDLTGAPRSPGSLLKPFIYGVAFDDGDLSPDAIVFDGPRAFGAYAPENFDRGFRGEVRVVDALRHSLNVTAVAALNDVGPARFRAALGAAGGRYGPLEP